MNSAHNHAPRWLRWYLAATAGVVCALAAGLPGLWPVPTCVAGLPGLWPVPTCVAAVAVPAVAVLGGLGAALTAERHSPSLPARAFGITLMVAGVVRVVRELHRAGIVGTVVQSSGLALMLGGILVGAAAIPSNRPSLLEALRTLFDGLLVTVVLLAFIWRFFFISAPGGAAAAMVAGLIADTAAIAFAVVILVRDVDRPIRVAALGLALVAVSDAANAVHLVHHSTNAPWEPLVKCLAFALVTYGVTTASYIPPRLSLLAQQHLESRRIMFLATVTYSLVVADLAHMVWGEPLDGVAIGCVLLFIIAIWGQEVVRSRQSLQHAQMMAQQAVQDPLTRMPNRRGLTDFILHLDAPAGSPISAITLDLDGFKDVNDQCGQAAGDQVLSTVGGALVEGTAGWQAQVFRLGGDEFLCLGRLDAHDAQRLAEDIMTTVTRSLTTLPALGRVTLSVSLGVAHGTLPDQGIESAVSELISLSGNAMRTAKRARRGRIVVHDSELAKEQLRASRVEARLRQLLSEGGSPQVHYQPLMSLRQGTVAGVEALARWTDDELGFVSPMEFIEVAERTGLISTLGSRVLERAVSELAGTDFFARGMHLAANVSPIQLRQTDFVDTTMELLAHHGISPTSLVLEITESVSMGEEDRAMVSLVRLAEAGVGLAIDDFGAGYASIGYLQQLPVSVLKLDRSLSPAEANPRSDSIVKAVVELARGMDLDIIMEGVETTEQAQRAASFGIGYAQGWLYTKAVSLAELDDTIAALTTGAVAMHALPRQTDRAASEANAAHIAIRGA